MSQITFDGREVAVAAAPKNAPPLTPAQRAILLHLRAHGHIRSVEAGSYVHATDPRPCAPDHRRPYASTDGSEAMKRLAARGLAQRDPDVRGRWLPT
jgi:hypothetical protein